MKIKLITNSGFSKMIDWPQKQTMYIDYPFSKKIQLNSPELYGMQVNIGGITRFEFEKKYKNYSVYKQIDAIIEIK